MWSGTACACAIAATALASVALAQTSETQQDEPATSLEDIEVVGTPEAKTAAAYVRAIGTGPVGRLSPVWRRSLCVRIIEMDVEHARFLKSRIETVAAAVGLSTETSPICRPDISIYASTDPVALATTLIEAVPRRFQPAPNNTTLGDAAQEAFRTSSAPIRW